MKFTKIIIISLIIGSLIAIMFTLFGKKPVPQPLPILPSPSPAPISSLKMISVFPPEGDQPIIVPKMAIVLTYSQPIDQNSVSVSSQPTMAFSISVEEKEPNILYLKPAANWKLNTNYQITVTVTSRTGETLKNYQYKFTPILPQTDAVTYPPSGI